MKNEVFDYNNFYELSSPFATRPLIMGIQDKLLDSPKAIQIFYGEILPSNPIEFKAIAGGQVTDFLWSSLPPLFCVSQKVIDILIQNKFTGWSSFPVITYDRKGNLLSGYHGFSVKSYAGKIDISRSTIITKPAVPGYPKTARFYIGTFFNESKWDGSDIFRIQNACMVARKSIVEEFRRNNITNVRFTPLTETETMDAVYDTLKDLGKID